MKDRAKKNKEMKRAKCDRGTGLIVICFTYGGQVDIFEATDWPFDPRQFPTSF